MKSINDSLLKDDQHSKKYTKDDFSNGIEVRWCPGCGDYAILSAIQRVLPEIGLPPEKHVFVSGIGCAGRLPYYMNTYGFHTIHGRATAVATGLKTMRDDLCVWVITGDGDALSIGGNHLIHCLRRNVPVKILLFNNQVYGLTKGQFSPTSPKGQITKTSPSGVTNHPANPLALALAAGATFVARSVDKDPSHLASVLKQAYAHSGCAFVEIYQDCNIFNNGAFDNFALKNNRLQHTVPLIHGSQLQFGEDQALGLQGGQWIKTTIADPLAITHNVQDYLTAVHLTQLTFPQFPVPLGIFYQSSRENFCFSSTISKTEDDLSALYRAKGHWISK